MRSHTQILNEANRFGLLPPNQDGTVGNNVMCTTDDLLDDITGPNPYHAVGELLCRILDGASTTDILEDVLLRASAIEDAADVVIN
jgi:hypothetical protein